MRNKLLIFLFSTLTIIHAAVATPSLTEQITATAATTTPNQQLPTTEVPPPPQLAAKAYILMDANSGKIIAEKKPNKRMPPASLTKLMTLYIISQALANEEISLNDKVRISNKAWRTGGSRMFIKAGSEVSVKELVKGIIIASGNDATMAMAQYLGGTIPTFVQMMNRTAQQLNMTNTHYTDPTGLPAKGHYSTPYDIALLTRALITTFPQYYGWYKQKWILFNGIRQPNRNRLLWRDPSVDGVKTGHTDSAGFCLVSSAQRHGMRLIAVLMGAPTDSGRANESEALLNYGFRFYRTITLFNANTPIKQERVWLGKHKRVAIGVAKDLVITVPKSQAKKLNVTLTLKSKELKAPIEKGQAYGTINVKLNDKIIATQAVIALTNDRDAGFITRIWDHIALLLHKWFS